MALYVTRPRRDEEWIGRGLPSVLFKVNSGIINKLQRVPNIAAWLILRTKKPNHITSVLVAGIGRPEMWQVRDPEIRCGEHLKLGTESGPERVDPIQARPRHPTGLHVRVDC